MEYELSRRDFLTTSAVILTVFGLGGAVASCFPENKNGKFVDKRKVVGERVSLLDGGYRYRNPAGVGNRLHPDDVLVYLSRFHQVDRSNVQRGPFQFEMDFVMSPNPEVTGNGFASSQDLANGKWVHKYSMSMVHENQTVPVRAFLVSSSQVYLEQELAEVDKNRTLVLGRVPLGTSNEPNGFDNLVSRGFNVRLGQLKLSVGQYSFNSYLAPVETYKVR